MRRFASAAVVRSSWQAYALVFGLFAMVWGYYLGTHGVGSSECAWTSSGVPPNVPIPEGFSGGPRLQCVPSFLSSDLTAIAVFVPGLVTVLVVVGRHLPRRLSERVGGEVPRGWS